MLDVTIGSEVTPLPSAVVDNAGGRIVDSTGALELKTIPKTMAVVGGEHRGPTHDAFGVMMGFGGTLRGLRIRG
jgi:hypothetical protein